jgi:hypothetical protein
MTALPLVALLLAAQPRTVLPGGSIQAPLGCTAPAEIKELIDAFLGSVECPKQRLSMTVFGGAMVGDACSSKESQVTLQSSKGRAFVMCATQRRAAGGGRVIKELVIDVGRAHILAEVRSPEDVLLVLQLALSFEPD